MFLFSSHNENVDIIKSNPNWINNFNVIQYYEHAHAHTNTNTRIIEINYNYNYNSFSVSPWKWFCNSYVLPSLLINVQTMEMLLTEEWEMFLFFRKCSQSQSIGEKKKFISWAKNEFFSWENRDFSHWRGGNIMIEFGILTLAFLLGNKFLEQNIWKDSCAFTEIAVTILCECSFFLQT